MCKILILPGVTEERSENAWKMVKAASPVLSKNDNDGVGYAAMTKTGELFGERWIKPWQAFSRREVISESDRKLIATLKEEHLLEEPEEVYNSFGALTEENKKSAVGILLHARMATCAKTLANVHPFVRDNTALIHNGVISNHEELLKKTSTCDSEVILNEYVDYEVNTTLDNIKEMISGLQGYYACGVLSLDAIGAPIMDVFKNPTADLHVTFVNELDTVAFCTRKEMLETILKDLGWQSNTIFTVKSGKVMRFDLLTGKVVDSADFNISTYGSNVSSFKGRHYNSAKHKTSATNSNWSETKPENRQSKESYTDWEEDADYAALVKEIQEREALENKAQ